MWIKMAEIRSNFIIITSIKTQSKLTNLKDEDSLIGWRNMLSEAETNWKQTNSERVKIKGWKTYNKQIWIKENLAFSYTIYIVLKTGVSPSMKPNEESDTVEIGKNLPTTKGDTGESRSRTQEHRRGRVAVCVRATGMGRWPLVGTKWTWWSSSEK